MGELLRAVLDETCLKSMPVFYCVEILKTTPPISGVGSFEFMSRQLQLKANRLFLMTGYTLSTINLTLGVYNVPTEVSAISITDLVSGYQFDANINNPNQGQPRALANRNLNSFETMAEYALFRPNGLIQCSGVMLSRQQGPGNQFLDLITLAGIEYAE